MWNTSATAFRTVVEDAIANVTLTSTLRQRRNAGDARATGIELDGEVRPMTGTHVRVSAMVTDATFRNSLEPPLEGNRLPQVPRASFALEGGITIWKSTVISGVWRSTSSQFDDDRNQFELAPASQVDLRIAGRTGLIGWYLVLENVSDAQIEVGRTTLVTLAPGRAIRVGVNWRK